MQGKCHTVQRTPKDKTDGGTVPQTAQKHRQQQVEIGAPLALAVAAKRNVEVIPEPRRERNMPPAPEFGDGGRAVGGIEVFGETEAHHKGQTDGHIRVAREVAIDLQCIAVDAHQTLEARVEQRLIEDAVHEVQRDVVRNNGLLKQTREYQEEGCAEHLARHDRLATNLGNEVAGTHNRAGYKLRKEREVEEVVEPAVEWAQLSSVDVNRVAHRLEDEERDADGQEDVLKLQESRPEQFVGHIDQEVRVFEIAEHPEVDDNAHCHQPFSRTGTLREVERVANQVVVGGRQKQQHEVKTARFVVEVEREGHHVENPHSCGVAQQPIAQEEADKEIEEQPAAENQRRERVIAQECLQLGPKALHANRLLFG